MTYVPAKCGTLFIPSNIKDDKHLFFILNDACKQGCHLLVNVTSIYEGVHFDPACVVEVGEHPFIKHKSYMNYRLADVHVSARLTKMVGLRYFTPGDAASEELVEKILKGAEASDYIPKRILKYLKSIGR
ncbi:hypothetical protein K1X12_12735 [Hyphomonas sp. WL0036]|uniref:hypothetical protein n=1 Tax=Hyphomonas sediminis TaxID=2866160 RepID=UPI001C813953|nr:hypothetical protein [Hyphomonas sediminis]MBY9067771.1 hypothetical protein [Hyphomonas sediminis]